ncbi:MAG: energy transducer TonB [Muribaculum sp.]|nr:energy transducer TonB [Muribaculum sp.]
MKKTLLSMIFGICSLACMAGATPAFPGGDAALNAYISENLKYPPTAIDNGIEGTVEVNFTVKSDGTIGAIKIVRMVDPDLEQEAIRLVKNMPAWTPADSNGVAVDAPATVKVVFTLPE